jgi:tRNA dimethylallyltransferase
VALLTGEPISAQQRRHGFGDRLGELFYLVLDPGVAALKARIRSRSVELFARGLLEEVRSLWARGYEPDQPAMKSIGYPEAGKVLPGECGEQEALDDVIRRTERFAKRQRTWFRAEREAVWFDPRQGPDPVIDAVQRFLETRPAPL